MLKMICDREPEQGESLASQPTLFRFKNAVDRADLARVSREPAETVVRTQASRRRGQNRLCRIIIDSDPTCDPTHGDQ